MENKVIGIDNKMLSDFVNWKDIKGYEGRYQVSNMGDVRSLISGKTLKPSTNSNGYLRVCLMPFRKWPLVHRIVAEAFLEREDGKNIVNHKDGNRKNNMVDNLEWCTQSYNLRYSDVGVRINKDKRCSIVATNLHTGEKLYFESERDAERKGFNRKSIYCCLKTGRKQHRGFRWDVI